MVIVPAFGVNGKIAGVSAQVSVGAAPVGVMNGPHCEAKSIEDRNSATCGGGGAGSA